MIGHIESFDPDTQTGVIKSEEIYLAFHMDDWKPDVLPEPGDDVKFDEEEGAAKNVDLVGAYLEPPKPVKYKFLAGFLALLFGFTGIHRFYLGFYWIGLAQLVLSVLLILAGFVMFAPQWGFIDAFLIFAGHINKDNKGRPFK